MCIYQNNDLTMQLRIQRIYVQWIFLLCDLCGFYKIKKYQFYDSLFLYFLRFGILLTHPFLILLFSYGF